MEGGLIMGTGAARLGADKVEANRKILWKEERSAAEKKCQPLACKLGACAERYVYSPEKCAPIKAEYKACLAEFINAAATAAAADQPQQTSR